ncbi:hypothetical protein QBC34DRAFT_168937 [Podospora aff. communis PSN243]|uniref:Secreted peptide n=1 Tax=Podospora aff. communis PSN243 TaxID=3040156 RepID=A0AAV9GBI5_9PEZI|nr:hypothetical protein QBC34DRAFT_168937 [Podospora aff. communis PSN243]
MFLFISFCHFGIFVVLLQLCCLDDGACLPYEAAAAVAAAAVITTYIHIRRVRASALALRARWDGFGSITYLPSFSWHLLGSWDMQRYLQFCFSFSLNFFFFFGDQRCGDGMIWCVCGVCLSIVTA